MKSNRARPRQRLGRGFRLSTVEITRVATHSFERVALMAGTSMFCSIVVIQNRVGLLRTTTSSLVRARTFQR